MDISAINNITSEYIKSAVDSNKELENSEESSFGSVFASVINNLNETNELEGNAETEVIKFALGETNSTNDLTVAQQKARFAMQYTVTVRDKLLDAYKEIMNIAI